MRNLEATLNLFHQSGVGQFWTPMVGQFSMPTDRRGCGNRARPAQRRGSQGRDLWRDGAGVALRSDRELAITQARP